MLQKSYRLDATVKEQFLFDIHEELKAQAAGKFWRELNDLLSMAAEAYGILKATGLYLHIVFTNVGKGDAMRIRESVAWHLPQAVVSGITETIFERSEVPPAVTFNFTFLQGSKVELLEYNGLSGEYEEKGAEFGKQIAAIPDAKAVAVCCSGLTVELHHFITALSAQIPDCVVFGATAGMFERSADGSHERNLFARNEINAKDRQYIMGSELYDMGVVLAVFSGKNLHVQGDYVFGWKPLGKEMTITEVCGENGIARIDNMPATEIYRRYLKVSPDENFTYNISEFPLCVERNGMLIARVPPRFDEEGRLFFGGDVYQGEKLRLTYAVHDAMLLETERDSEGMCGFAPEAMFMVICGNRTFFLKDDAHKEIDYYRRFAKELVTNYGSSEIFCYQGQGGILNAALVAVGLREGEPKPADCYAEFCHGCDERDQSHRIIPLAERMATFLDVTSQELTEMAHAAKEASRAKSQFLSGMSHEIRTPINAVLGMDEMILRETQEENTREYAQNIRAAGTTLLGLVNDILDFSKIEAGKMAIIPVEYAVSSLLNDLVNMIRQRAEKKGLQFHVEIPDDMPSILKGDEIRLRQVAVNILTNAVKYTEEGSVTLKLSYKKIGDNRIALTTAVKDTGIGIKKEDIAKLFHAFERIEEERNRTIEGTGLGMNITQKLLEMMGSRLEVESVYGEGSEFSYTVEQEVLNWSPMGNYEESYRRMMATQTAYKESFVAPDAKILVVDDTAMNLTVVRGLLKQTMVQVETVLSGYECLARAEKEHFDLIFLDHRMPGLDGIETLRRLQTMNKKENALNAHTPVVALTANAVSGAREEYIAAGFDDYLTKPIDSHKLEDMLRNMLPQEKVRAAGVVAVPQEEKLPDWLEYVVGIDPHKGVEHCGSVTAYMDALKVFAQSIESNAEEIQRYYDTGDWQNYTTKVHALKSTARVIGAAELSEKARRLEDAGNNCYCDEIETGTGPLLDLYRSYASSLSMLIPAEKAAEEKVPISPAELSEAWETLTEIVTSFDYDSLEYMLGELSGYQLPSADAEKLAQIKKAAAVPEWDKLQQLLSIART